MLRQEDCLLLQASEDSACAGPRIRSRGLLSYVRVTFWAKTRVPMCQTLHGAPGSSGADPLGRAMGGVCCSEAHQDSVHAIIAVEQTTGKETTGSPERQQSNEARQRRNADFLPARVLQVSDKEAFA